ncbi:hypothetical protein [Clavibacter tessellarius]|uniref:hypothetical protein n=1 Tax=Clavibacter tessellarius TaxID=31965 RepID=UPI0032558924
MTDSTYTAQLVGPEGTEETEVEFLNGEPVKSFTRATSLSEEEVVWETRRGRGRLRLPSRRHPGRRLLLSRLAP